MINEKHKNKRYISLARESDDSQGQASTEAQTIFMKSMGDKYGMTHVDTIALKGVTGSLPGQRKDLEQLLERKRSKNDFDVIVVQLCDRLTRGGSSHALWFEYECSRVGLEVLYVGDDIPEGPYANLIKVAKFEAARSQAVTISQRSTQGSQLAIEEGRNATCAHTPYGCWRLYLTAEGKPSHIIRDCGDGRQQKLDPTDHHVIDTYGSIGGGGKGHYRKQKSEKVLIMPGDPDKMEIVQEIFHRHFIDGWGGVRIADVLNRRGISSPWGKEWSQGQVDVIYKQSAYTGRTVGSRSSTAIYHERQSKSPKPVDLAPAVLAGVGSIPKRHRPREEWTIQEQPLMVDFLSPDIRKLAIAANEERWRRESDPDRPKRSTSKHRGSDYLLTNLLVAEQDGEMLTGVLCGPADRRVRYYRHRRDARGYRKGSIFNGMFPAEPLEKEVLRIVREFLTDVPELRQRIAQVVEQQLASAAQDQPKLDELCAKRDQLARKLNLIVASLDDETLTQAKEQINRLKTERRTLDEQIGNLESARQSNDLDPQAAVERVIQRLGHLGEQLTELPVVALRQALAAVVGRIVCDMATKAVRIEFVLPPWVLWPSNASGELRLERSLESSTSYETHRDSGVPLGVALCSYGKSHRNVCYRCRRLRKAA